MVRGVLSSHPTSLVHPCMPVLLDIVLCAAQTLWSGLSGQAWSETSKSRLTVCGNPSLQSTIKDGCVSLIFLGGVWFLVSFSFFLFFFPSVYVVFDSFSQHRLGIGAGCHLPTFEGDASLVESFSYRVWFSKQQRLCSLDQLGLPLRVHQE